MGIGAVVGATQVRQMLIEVSPPALVPSWSTRVSLLTCWFDKRAEAGVPAEVADAEENRCEDSSEELRIVCNCRPLLLEAEDRPVALEIVEESGITISFSPDINASLKVYQEVAVPVMAPAWLLSDWHFVDLRLLGDCIDHIPESRIMSPAE